MKSLAILYPNCISFEILLACEILNNKFPVDVATPDGSDHIASNGLTIKSNLSFKTVNPTDYKTILVPGGDPAAVINNQSLKEILQKAYSNKSIIGAICAGPVLLEQAGLLNQRKIAHGYAGPQKDWLLNKGYFKNTLLTDEPIIVDQQIVTARPEAYIDFAIEIGVLAGCVKPDQSDSIKRYYKGEMKV
jgi:putative intracellular protease/amidase